MSAKRRKPVRTLLNQDDPPEITEAWLQEADLMKGDKVVRRGRPKLENPKQLLSLRLQPEVIAAWKASGSGWQTRMAELLKKSSPKARRHAG
jgi:uncharacterized protein (DUF4415 family)